MQLYLDVLVLEPTDCSFGKDNEIFHKIRTIAGLNRSFLASCEQKHCSTQLSLLLQFIITLLLLLSNTLYLIHKQQK